MNMWDFNNCFFCLQEVVEVAAEAVGEEVDVVLVVVGEVSVVVEEDSTEGEEEVVSGEVVEVDLVGVVLISHIKVIACLHA